MFFPPQQNIKKNKKQTNQKQDNPDRMEIEKKSIMFWCLKCIISLLLFQISLNVHIIFWYFAADKNSNISILEKTRLKVKWLYLHQTYFYLAHLPSYPESFALYFGATLQKYSRTYILRWRGSGLIFSCWRRPAI